jgi:hypothetical protein
VGQAGHLSHLSPVPGHGTAGTQVYRTCPGCPARVALLTAHGAVWRRDQSAAMSATKRPRAEAQAYDRDRVKSVLARSEAAS